LLHKIYFQCSWQKGFSTVVRFGYRSIAGFSRMFQAIWFVLLLTMGFLMYILLSDICF